MGGTCSKDKSIKESVYINNEISYYKEKKDLNKIQENSKDLLKESKKTKESYKEYKEVNKLCYINVDSKDGRYYTF